MEIISDSSAAVISGSLQRNCTPNQINITANENVFAVSETITDYPEHVVIGKTSVVQRKMVVEEKVCIPKNGANSSNCEMLSDVRMNLTSPTAEVLNETEILNDKIDASEESKMENSSQESGEVKMDVCSQESVLSSMELGSQENDFTESLLDLDIKREPLATKKLAEQELSNKTPVNNDDSYDKNNLKMKKRVKQDDEDSSDELQIARETSLSIREKTVAEREAAVSLREKLIQNVENIVYNHTEHSDSKQRKRRKLSY